MDNYIYVLGFIILLIFIFLFIFKLVKQIRKSEVECKNSMISNLKKEDNNYTRLALQYEMKQLNLNIDKAINVYYINQYPNYFEIDVLLEDKELNVIFDAKFIYYRYVSLKEDVHYSLEYNSKEVRQNLNIKEIEIMINSLINH